MLSKLPSILTPSATAAADSLAGTPRSSAEGGPRFAALMQQQSELRLSDQRLAEQQRTQARSAEPGATDALARSVLRHEPGSPSGSGSGSASTPGASTRPADAPLAGRPAATDPASPNTPAGTGDAGGTTGAALGDSAESRSAASLTHHSKLQRARSAAQGATRQTTADAAPPRSLVKSAAAAPADADADSTALGARHPDDVLLASTPTPDTTGPTGTLRAGPAVALPALSGVAGGAPLAATPRPLTDAPDAAAADLRGDSLSALGRTGPQRKSVASGAGEVAGPPGSSRSTAGWVAEQQHLRDVGISQPTRPASANPPTSAAAAPTNSLPAAAEGQDDTRAALLAASAGLTPTARAQASSGSAPEAAAGPATALVRPRPSPSTGRSDRPGSAPGEGETWASTSTAAATAAAATSAGASQRGAALTSAPDSKPPEALANASRTAPTLDPAADLPDQPGTAHAGRSVRQAGTASPTTSASTPLFTPQTNPMAGAAQVADPGLLTHDAATLTPDRAASRDIRSGSRIDSAGETGNDSPAGTGAATDLPSAATASDAAAVSTDTRASTLASAGPSLAASLRPGAAAADRRPGRLADLADKLADANDPDSAARPASSPPVAAAKPRTETAAPASPLPAPDLTAAAHAANAAAAPADSRTAPTAPQTPGPVAGTDPRRALAAAAGPDSAAASRRTSGTERLSGEGRDSASAEAADPADLPATRRSAEPARAAGPFASGEAATSAATHPAANGTGLDNTGSRHPTDNASASDAGPAALIATTTAAATAGPSRSDASGPNAVPVEARIAAPLDSPAFAPALGAQISLFARDGVQTARLQLNPAEMGPIAVQIALDGNAARIEFQAERAATREVIEASLPALAGALQDAGLTLTGGGVFQQHPGRQAPPEPGPTTATTRLPARDTRLDAVAGGLAASSRQRAARGLVDLVA